MVLREKPIVALQVKKFSSVYRTQGFNNISPKYATVPSFSQLQSPYIGLYFKYLTSEHLAYKYVDPNWF
jgi:hypothetical protein